MRGEQSWACSLGFRSKVGSGVRTVTVKHLGKEANTVTIHF